MSLHHDDEVLQPAAALLAWLLPGLGYVYLGDRRRAAAVGLSILGLFTGGVFIGGIDVVDRAEDKWWYVLQVLNGPVAIAADYAHQNYFKMSVTGFRGGTQRVTPPPPAPGSGPPPKYSKSLARVNEAGTLYTAMAGMLNLIAVLDCLWHRPPARRRANAGGAG